MEGKKIHKKPEWILWVIRVIGLFLTICWYFFYRTPNIYGNFLYRMGGLAEDIVILLILYKITSFNFKGE